LELLAYIDSKQDFLASLPFGLYSVTPTDHEHTTPKGVIFCLKQIKRSEQIHPKDTPTDPTHTARAQQQINALHPYFLLYVRDDGAIRYGFAHPKQILDRFRELCLGQTQPHQALCELFDKQTQNGGHMALYDGLLKKAIAAITQQTEKRVLSGLLHGKDMIIPKQQDIAKDEDDFELISWLVVASR
jgi:hypothetical protein